MVACVIVAAGQGVRMRSEQRKQYMDLGGRPVLARTVDVFDACSIINDIYLVIPKGDHDFCEQSIVPPRDSCKRVVLVSGGCTRQESVYNGLTALDESTELVVIHDGVRPFVTEDDISATVRGAGAHGACVLAVPSQDTLKEVGTDRRILTTLSRQTVWFAQTPQAFRYRCILEAHERARADGFEATDDACLVERLGKTVRVVQGTKHNIKITTNQDMDLARALLSIVGNA
ncbi:2-C-methyl-D-erythritol 4-phosphate cytidylyltransferase [Thermodesulfobacteriota bacterium]